MSTKQPYTAPAVQEIGSVAQTTLAASPKSFADQAIPAGQPLTSS